MALDSRGIVSVVEIIVYTPLLLLSIKLLVKYGFKREGWLYLLLLSISTPSRLFHLNTLLTLQFQFALLEELRRSCPNSSRTLALRSSSL